MPACPSISSSGPLSSATTTFESNNPHILPPGAIGGIVVAVVTLIILTGGVFHFVFWKKRAARRRRYMAPELYGDDLSGGINGSSSGHYGRLEPKYKPMNISFELHGFEVATAELSNKRASRRSIVPRSQRPPALSKLVEHSSREVNQDHYTNESADGRTTRYDGFSPLGHTPFASPMSDLSSPLSNFGHTVRAQVQDDFYMTEPTTPPESKRLVSQDGLRHDINRTYSFPGTDPQHGRYVLSVGQHNGSECTRVPHSAPVQYDTPLQYSTSMLQDPQDPMRQSTCFDESTLWWSPQDLSSASSGALNPKRIRRNSNIVDRRQYSAEFLSLNMTDTFSSPDLPYLPMNQPKSFTPAYDRVGSSPIITTPTLSGGVSEPGSKRSWSSSDNWSTTNISTAITTPISSLFSPKLQVETACHPSPYKLELSLDPEHDFSDFFRPLIKHIPSPSLPMHSEPVATDTPTQCVKCDTTFGGKYAPGNLKRHDTEKHGPGQKSHCSYCRRGFSRNTYRKHHEEKCPHKPR